MPFGQEQEMGRPVSIKDEGITLTPNVGSIDFAGAGVTGTTIGSDVTETIPGGSTSPLTTKGDLFGFSTVDARIPVGGDGLVLVADSTQPLGVKWTSIAGTGDVVGPGSATDNAVVRFDATTGKLIQNSVITISDAGDEVGILTWTTSPTKGTPIVGSDVLTDPDFELWTSSSVLTDWATGQIIGTGVLAREASIVHSGTYSAHLTGDGGATITQLLTDGPFEVWTNPSTLTDWTINVAAGSPTLTQEASIVHGGTYSAKVTGTNSGPDLLGLESNLSTSLSSGATVTFSGWGNNNGGSGGAGAFFLNDTIAAATQIYNFNTVSWETITVGTVWSTIFGGPSNYITMVTNPTTWTQFSGTLTVPANGQLEMVALGVPTGGAFTVYLDDYSMTISTSGTPNVAFVENTPATGLTPADVFTFVGYQRNASGSGNGFGAAAFFNGTTTGTATQIYNFNSSSWVTWVDWATTVIGPNLSHFFAVGSETTSFASFTATIPVPANGTLVCAAAALPSNTNGPFSVYLDTFSLTSPSSPAALINAFHFKNNSDPANIVSSDKLINFELLGGSGVNLLTLNGDGTWTTGLSNFDFSSKTVKVGTPSSGTDAVNVTYYNANMFALPSQTGNNGKFLTTNGSSPSWSNVSGGVADLTNSFYANQGTVFQVLHGNGSGNLSWSAVALSSDVSGQLPIANGGTGQATAQAGFNALSPLTTLGDLLFFDGANNSRFAGNTAASTLFLAQTGDGVNVTGMAWTAAGTVTDVSIASANGFAGTVANSTSTPAITLSTTVTGILQGNGTAISAASTTGSGNVVLDTSPTLVTPNIGAASGTSLNLSGLTASQAVVTDGSKNLASLAYGTTSSASSLVERDANQNAFANNFTSKATNVTSSGATTTLTTASARWQNLTGSANQTFKLPDATTLTIGSNWQFNNNSSGVLTVIDGASGALFTIPSGGQGFATLMVNVITAGVWDYHFTLPSNASFGTAGLVITGDISATTYGGQTVNWGAGGTIAYTSNSLSDFAVPTGDVAWNSKKITGLADPGSNQDAATKIYVDTTVNSLSLKNTVRLTTAAALDTSTYSNGSSGVGATLTATANGALTVDGTSASNGDRILVKDQASPLENGVYTVTDAGSVGTPWIITRATDSDTSAEIIFEFFFTREGSTNISLGFVNTNATAITIGTDSITYTVFSASGSYTAGNGLSLTGGAFFIDTSITADLTSTQTLLNKTLTSPVINSPTGITATDVGLGNVTNDAQIPLAYLDTDGTLAADSDTKVASQKATKTYVDTNISALNLNTLAGAPLAIANGGTGQTTANAALNALLPTQTTLTGYVLKTDGTNTSWLQLPDFTTFMVLANNETVTGIKSFNSGKLKLNGATSGTTILNAASVAGTTTQTLQDATGTVALLSNSLDQFAAPAANVDWNSKKITNLLDPTNAQDAATKAYTDSVAAGLVLKPFCVLATAAALPASTYNNGTGGVGATLTGNSTGTLTVDGTTVALNDRILVKNQSSQLENGIYDCTTAGAGGVAFVLTRSTDSDSGAEVRSEYTFVVGGSTNANIGFVNTNPTAPTIGTDAITYTIFSTPATYSAGTGLTLTSTTFSIDTSITVDKTTAQTLTNKTLTSPVINTPTGIVKGDVGLGNVSNVDQIPLSYLDTDGTFGANSDTKVPSQKAAKTYVDTSIAALTLTGISGTLSIAKGGTGLTSFTAGQIHFGSFSTDSNLYWDNTNKRLSIGFGTSPTANLHLKAGTTSAGSAPLKFASGTNMTSAEAGAVEYDGTALTYTDSTPTRQTLATTSSTQTLTNKRITKRIVSTTSSATPTPNVDTTDQYEVTALAVGATFGAPTGTPTDGQVISFRVKDNGSAQTLAFNSIYRFSSDLVAPTTTVISKTLYMLFEYNATDVKYDCLSWRTNY